MASLPLSARFRLADGNFDRRRRHLEFLPVRKREGDLRGADSCFSRDSHGALESAPSSPVRLKLDQRLDWPSALLLRQLNFSQGAHVLFLEFFRPCGEITLGKG